jgi:pyridoxine 5-phosphate synthase
MNPLVAPEAAGPRHAGTALSVNVNKVALLRNTRHIGIPEVVRAARHCLQAGADGITVHPRPDERHIRGADVHDIAALLREWPQAEYNIEGNPFHNLMAFVRAARPQQATFVPDSEGQFTSDHGWDLDVDGERLRPLIDECHALGVRVSLFMDPLPEAMALARRVGADRVELYTEPYAAAHAAAHAAARAADRAADRAAGEDGAGGAGRAGGTRIEGEGATAARATADAALTAQTARFAAAAAAAQVAGLGVNAGHDLNRDNLLPFLRAVPGVLEVSIGHALVADALELGWTDTVRAYQRCIRAAHGA